MLQALLISNGIVGLNKWFVSSDLVQYTTCYVTKDFAPDLSAYDLLVVPNGCDHVAMLKIKKQVRTFLNAGKTLICGDGWFTAWVPGNQWLMCNTHRTQAVRYFPHTDRYGLLHGLDLEELNFAEGMSGWWACGYIRAAPTADVLLCDTWQRPIVVLDEVSTRGRMLLTASAPLADFTFDSRQDSAMVTLYRNFLHLLLAPRPVVYG